MAEAPIQIPALPAIGPQYKVPTPLEQEQLDQTRFQGAAMRWSVLEKLFSMNPALADQPQYAQPIRTLFSQMGIPLPEKFDYKALVGPGQVAQWIDKNWDTFMSLPVGEPRRDLLKVHGFSTIPPELDVLINTKQELTPQQRLAAAQQERMIMLE